ncbi:hypothetical protein CCMA1212_003340 [Trichoderma ghanense]|uniref:Uncharacterized protein n=1 Tax=Trichoderma ghanense TaxID=65468 RepID=A0ABY2HA41_9HYPO
MRCPLLLDINDIWGYNVTVEFCIGCVRGDFWFIWRDPSHRLSSHGLPVLFALFHVF